MESIVDTSIAKVDRKLEELASSDAMAFSKLPVGSIIPFAGSLGSLVKYSNWRLCDGGVLSGEDYKNSPFYNTPVPNLNHYYLKGTLDQAKVLTLGGNDSVQHSHENPHTHPVPHKHSGKTNPGVPHNGPKKDDHHTGGNHDHTFTTGGPDIPVSGDSLILKGSIETIEVDPKHVKVFYIIKVL